MIPLRIAAAIGLPALAVVGALTVASAGTADPAGACTMGSSYTTDLVVAVDGAPQAAAGPGVFGPYAVSLCRTEGNGPGSTSTYNFSVQRVATGPSGGPGGGPGGPGGGGGTTGLIAEDAGKTFSIGFTPQAGDTPLAAEGKANIQSFGIDSTRANAVTLTAQPLGFADIQGCTDMPVNCVTSRPTASFYNPANLSGAIRYSAASGEGAAGFSDLPGLTTSSGAYIFFVWASCPTNTTRDQSFSGLKVDLGGPHFMPDGSVNSTLLKAYIPAIAVASCFGATPQAYAQNAQVTRTENGTTTTGTTGAAADPGLQYVIAATDAGVTISVPQVTFSSPTYDMSTKSGKSLAKVKKTTAALTKAAKVSKPSGGSVAIVVAKSSKKVCVSTPTTVFGFGKGTCNYSAVSYSKAGKKVKSVKGSFKVK